MSFLWGNMCLKKHQIMPGEQEELNNLWLKLELSHMVLGKSFSSLVYFCLTANIYCVQLHAMCLRWSKNESVCVWASGHIWCSVICEWILTYSAVINKHLWCARSLVVPMCQCACGPPIGMTIGKKKQYQMGFHTMDEERQQDTYTVGWGKKD